jgi:leucyl aminopeptidase (aminopeptidase T)
MSLLDEAIRTVVKDCLVVKPAERLTVVCDETTEELGGLMRAQGEAAGATAEVAQMASRGHDGEEPPEEVAAAMLASDAVLAPTAKSLSHTQARQRACEAGARIATLPGVTEEMLARTMSVDLRAVGQLAGGIAERLTKASEAHITCERGSDLRLQLSERNGIADDGRLSSPGSFGNLPCGEGFVAPIEDSGDGRLVVDGSIAGLGMLDDPAWLELEGGRLVSGTGRGERLLEHLTQHGGQNVAELGIGCNGRARVTGNVLEDEKVLGTVHVAFGASASFGGDVQVPVHLDCVVLRPRVELDGELIVDGGRLHV